MVKVNVPATPSVGPSAQKLTTYKVDYSGIARGGQAVAAGLRTVSDALAVREGQKKATERFDVLTGFTDWQTQTAQQLQAFEQSSPVDTANFIEQMDAQVETARAKFLKDVPPELQPEFEYRTQQVKQGFMGQALKFDLAQRDLYFSSKISERLEATKKELAQTPGALEAARAEIYELIDASGLDAANKLKQKKLAGAALTAITYRSVVADERKKQLATAQTVGADAIAATDLPPIAGGVLNAIGKRESGNRYDIRYDGSAGGGKINSFADHPRQFARGPHGRSSAAGKYMFIGSTWDIAARGAGVNDFQPASQDKAAWFWANRTAKVETGKTVEELIAAGDFKSLKSAFETQWEGVKHMSLEEFTGIVNAGAAVGDTTVTPEQFMNDPRFSDLSYDEMLSVTRDGIAQADAEYAARTKQLDAQEDAQRNQLYVSLFDGNAGATDIENARKAGWLSDIDDIEKAYKIIDKRDGDSRRLREAQDMLDNRQSWVKGNDDHSARANALFGEEGANALDNKDQTYVDQTLLPRWEKMEYAAPDMVNHMLAMTRQADETKALFAFEAMRQMRERRPEAFGAQFSEDIQRKLDMYEYGSNYWGDEGLVSRIQGRGLTQEDRQAKQALQAQAADVWNEEVTKKNFNAKNYLAESVGPLIGFDPDTPLPAGQSYLLDNEFRTLFIDSYAALGDADAAKELAAKSMARYWQTTEIGGAKRLMKFPPQSAGYKAYRGSFDWIDSQVREMYGWDDNVQFQLVATEQTESEIAAYKNGRGKPPSYLVYYTDEDGYSRYAPVPGTSEVRNVYFEWTDEMTNRVDEDWQRRQTIADREQIISDYESLRVDQELYDLDKAQAEALHVPFDRGPRPEIPQALEDAYSTAQQDIMRAEQEEKAQRAQDRRARRRNR